MAREFKNKKEKKKSQAEINRENLQAGISYINQHPLFGYSYYHLRNDGRNLGKNVYATVSSKGEILLNENMHLQPKQWAYVIAHAKLHLAFGHFDADKMPGYTITDTTGKSSWKTDFIPLLWNMACDIYIDKFLADIKFGQSIHENIETMFSGSLDDEIQIYNQLLEQNITGSNNVFGTAAIGALDMKGLEVPLVYDDSKGQFNHYTKGFSEALARSVSKAVSTAAGFDSTCEKYLSPGMQAAKWFMNHYPLLGGLASHFKIIENYSYCQKNDIQIAAIDVTLGELYLNPTAGLSFEELKFVLAHEYLHAGLMHHNRCNGRDHYLWNVACDFVINGWLHELQVGTMPEAGLLYDVSLKGMSAESIYDLMLSDMRKYEKLNTFRGYHKGDIIGGASSGNTSGTTLDDFCRNAMQQGLEYHVGSGRCLVPAGLIEEIRALSMPAIPWDVSLAKWFDTYFAPLEKHRTYARPSRRQASTPDIPRPRCAPLDIAINSRTFGVVIDTSGSMDAKTIGKALGSIASYSVAHDVQFARVVFCDADAYDAGYISPEDIAGRVAVKGRGGTALQPAINLLETAKDFPKGGPILIITDGEIEEHLDIKHEHAYLLPKGNRLPFRAKGQVFYFDN
ncbi:MAG: hypothetical protein K6B41_09925 [Butyrivibrio sp.]|nr:hypothetical protein [Butyrivibrio sp.]